MQDLIDRLKEADAACNAAHVRLADARVAGAIAECEKIASDAARGTMNTSYIGACSDIANEISRLGETHAATRQQTDKGQSDEDEAM